MPSPSSSTARSSDAAPARGTPRGTTRAAPSVAALALAAALAGCAAGEPSVADQRSPVNVAYSCRDGQTPVVRYFPEDRATVRLDDGRAVELAREVSASGERYGGDGITLWAKGGEATLEVGGRSTACRRVD